MAQGTRLALSPDKGRSLHGQVVGTRLGIAATCIGKPVADRCKVAGQIPGRSVALLRILGEAPLDDPKEGCRRLGSSLRMAAMISAWLLPGNARRPVTIS